MMSSFVTIDSRIKSLRSQKAGCTRRIKESREAIANARAFGFDFVRVQRAVDRSEVLIAQAQQRIEWIDKRIAELKELSKQTPWIEVTSASAWSSYQAADKGGK